MEKIELLAPAGNEESLLSAINAGADAVYLGLGDFNARGNIKNFNLDSLRICVDKAHLFGVKVYLTLNTIVVDDEIEHVLDLVMRAIQSKVDAFIVQDLGLAFVLRNKFPEIELHASTQMGVHNLEGATFLKKLGFKRIVLARETPLYEIKRIKDNLDIEIEYFIQGALCVSFSGNCYLCSLYANASGNRGKCKQFCRLPFRMENERFKKEGYLLSTKDFCMLASLKNLVENGVTSLKIEGRARRPAYVAGAVSVYRKALDNNFDYDENSLMILKKLFNRGDYINGYFNKEKIIYNKSQNHKGICIGKVLSVKRGKRFNEVVILSSHNLIKGDALKFFIGEKEMASLSVQDVKEIGKSKFLFTTTTMVPENSEVNLIVDSRLENELLNLKRKINVIAKFKGMIGQNATLLLSAGNIEVEARSDQILEEAKGQPLIEEDCKAQISKMGVDFNLEKLSVCLENVFLAKSQLNKLRRDALEKLKDKLIKNNEKLLNIEERELNLNLEKSNKKNNKKILYFNSLKKFEKYIDSQNYLVFNPESYDLSEISAFCHKFNQKTIYLSLPVIAEENDINLIKALLKNNDNLGVVANNYYALSLTSPSKTIIGSSMNVANSLSVRYYSTLGYNKIILTKENFDIENIADCGRELFIETNIRKTLMHFKHCPFKENLDSNCNACRFKEGTKCRLNDRAFIFRRKKLTSCQFELVEEKSSTISTTRFGEVVEVLD